MFLLLPIAGCVSSTECDCVPPMIFVFGTISGATAPVAVDVRLGQGVCRADSFPIGIAGTGRAETDGSYQVGVSLPQPGPACIVVTATTLDLPLITVTRRVDAVIAAPTNGDPQRIRADVALAVP